MAQNITTYRYNNGYGIKTGFTDNSLVNITPIILTSGQGTSSMIGTFSVAASNEFTYANLQGPLVGNANIVINATASQIFDHIEILVAGGSATASVVLSGDVASNTSLTNSLSPSKYLKIAGQFNGKVFVVSTIQTV